MSTVDRFWLDEDGRLYAAMHTLVYPGVLGSLLYAVPDNLTKGVKYAPETLWLGSVFALAFVFDYIHTVGPRFKDSYSYKLFLLDLVIVAMLFGAGQRILGNTVFVFLSVPTMLAIAKFAAALWEMAAETREDSARNTDLLLGFLYVGIAVVMGISGAQCWTGPPVAGTACPTYWSLGLGLTLFADAMSFLYYKKLARTWTR